MDQTGREGLEYLVELGKKLVPVEKLEFEGRNYTRQQLNAVDVPLPSAIEISTLDSLIDLCSGKFGTAGQGFEFISPTEHVVHVVSPTRVQVVTALSNEWRKRSVLIDCKLTETTQFQLGKFMNQDEFIIAVLSCFVQDADRDYVAKLAGNATSEIIATAQDDGVSQQVGVRSGAHLADQQTVKNIVTLRLFRTFREVEQPASKFLFRLKQSGENVPNFAFFEADGGAWKLEAIENVARFLRAGLKDMTVAS